MKSTWLIGSALILLSAMFGVSYAAESDLAFSLELDKNKYRQGEPIILTLNIENLSEDDGVLFPRRLHMQKYLKVRITDEANGEIEYQGVVTKMAKVRPRDFLFLSANHYYGRRYNLSKGKDKFALVASGKYLLECSYVNNDKNELLTNHRSEMERTYPYAIQLDYVWSGEVTFDDIQFEIE